MTITTEKRKEVLKMFTFKPTPLTDDKDKMETVIATTLDAAYQKSPDKKKWILHAIDKNL